MAKKISNNILKVTDSVGNFSGVAAMCGESSYDIAVRNGFSGTEAEFLAQFAPDELVQGVTELKASVENITPYASAAAHNAIYRGKDLTDTYTVDQVCAMISAGTFDDLYIGDTITVTINTSIGGSEVVKGVIADFDAFYNNGDTALTKHHAVIVPKDCFKTTAHMNDTNTTVGGYFSSDMHTNILPVYAEALQTAFKNHILTYRSLLTTAINADLDSNAGAGWKGASTNWEWKDTVLRLMNEVNLYGSTVLSSSFYDTGANNTQFALFRHNPAALIAGLGNGGARQWWWLSAVASSTSFATCSSYGLSGYCYASALSGIRPYFLIG
jgi:hypothetical protein